jgi:transcriptional antiterminator RfaH
MPIEKAACSVVHLTVENLSDRIDDKQAFLPPDPWLVVYTRPRAEKKVVASLNSMGIETFCPMVLTERRWSDRKKKIWIPVISSYVFVRIPLREKNRVFDSGHVLRYLWHKGKPALVREHEIEAMRSVLNYNIKETVVEHFQRGETIAIPNGPFSGKRALIEDIERKYIYLILEESGIRVRIKLA